MKKNKLIPVDKKRCQALKTNGNNFMTFGGVPRMMRCDNKPTVIVKETKPGKDGLKGSMSLCDECLTVAKKNLPKNFFTEKKIEVKSSGRAKKLTKVQGEQK
jgi:hypothetical protein